MRPYLNPFLIWDKNGSEHKLREATRFSRKRDFLVCFMLVSSNILEHQSQHIMRRGLDMSKLFLHCQINSSNNSLWEQKM